MRKNILALGKNKKLAQWCSFLILQYNFHSTFERAWFNISMKEFSLICFDLDGTLADTSLGIREAYAYTCAQLGINENDVMFRLDGVIGCRPLDVFMDRLGLQQSVAETAVHIYRNYYEKHGLFNASIYPGIEELLCYLQKNDYLLAVTTLKYDPFAKTMLNHLGIARYFHAIFGCEADNLDTKASLLHKAMLHFHKLNSQTILLGDSETDALGAKAAGVAFAGVTYGLGFHSKEEASVYHPCLIAKTPSELMQYL